MREKVQKVRGAMLGACICKGKQEGARYRLRISAGAGVGEGNRCTGGEEEMHSVE